MMRVNTRVNGGANCATHLWSVWFISPQQNSQHVAQIKMGVDFESDSSQQRCMLSTDKFVSDKSDKISCFLVSTINTPGGVTQADYFPQKRTECTCVGSQGTSTCFPRVQFFQKEERCKARFFPLCGPQRVLAACMRVSLLLSGQSSEGCQICQGIPTAQRTAVSRQQQHTCRSLSPPTAARGEQDKPDQHVFSFKRTSSTTSFESCAGVPWTGMLSTCSAVTAGNPTLWGRHHSLVFADKFNQ